MTTHNHFVTTGAAVDALRSCAAIERSAHLPSTHHERATTSADTQHLLSYMLSADPDMLHESFPTGSGSDASPDYSTFSKASKAEFAAKKKAEAVETLYKSKK